MERYTDRLSSGEVLHTLHDGEGRGFGCFVVLEDGRAQVWTQTWHDRFAPETHPGAVYPGPISAMRALRRGEW